MIHVFLTADSSIENYHYLEKQPAALELYFVICNLPAFSHFTYDVFMGQYICLKPIFHRDYYLTKHHLFHVTSDRNNGHLPASSNQSSARLHCHS